jgi:hypothetical protein
MVFCNRSDADTSSLASAVAEIFLKDNLRLPGPEADEPEVALAAAEWQPGDQSRYAGAYFSEEANARCVLDERGGKLVLETCGEGEELKPGKPGEFVTESGWLSLRFASGGKDTGSFIYYSSGLRGLPFKKVKESTE